jgi:hypothetical protein
MKLYTSKKHPQQWVAYEPGIGWLVFPNNDHGWEDRKPARGLDPIHLREVPLHLAASTGVQPSANN